MDKEKTGRFISLLRKEKGMTQKELADKLHVSDRTISKWERGAGLPDASLMIGLSDLLGISVNELLAGERSAEEEYPLEAKEEIRDAVSTLYQHMHAQERKLRSRLIAAMVLIALVIGSAGLALKKVEENHILFPPEIQCELLQKDIDVEATLFVDRRTTGVYDYICAYNMDRYGTIGLSERSMWQSYTDTVPSKVYKGLKACCPGEITSIDITKTGYLACSYKDPVTRVVTETDASLNVVFQYQLDTSRYTAGLITAFLSDDVLYMVSYNSDEQRDYITAVNKITGQERVNSFIYSDFVPGAGEEDSMGGFLFDRNNMWVKDGIFYFAETYHKSVPVSVFGAYDLNESRPVFFDRIENAQVVMTYQEPELGQVAVLINPMDYRPLELYTIDDTTMEVKSVTRLELPNEYLTRQGSIYASDTYFLFHGDMSKDRISVLFGDIASQKDFDNHTGSCIMVVYDRASGEALWRGRFMMDMEYEISHVIVNFPE